MARAAAAAVAAAFLVPGCATEYEKGLEAQREGHTSVAQLRFTRAIADEPEHRSLALLRRAQAEIVLGDFEGAAGDLASARELGVDVDGLTYELQTAHGARAARRCARGDIAVVGGQSS